MSVDDKPRKLAVALLDLIDGDRARLERLDNYVFGIHDDPYLPDNADEEYCLLAKRAVSNWIPLLVNTPAQGLYVDSFRPSRVQNDLSDDAPEWKHWQQSRLDARQSAIYRGALRYGHSFTLTEFNRNGILQTKGLSSMLTSALYEDPANDCDPYAALTIVEMPAGDTPGEARMWDATNEYRVTFKSLSDTSEGVTVALKGPHKAQECPVTRFAVSVDLEGRTVGVVEPMIPLQNRINQTVFDLLLAQSYSSTKVRYASGMAPPMIMEPVDDEGNVTYDPEKIADVRPKKNPRTGEPIPKPMNHNAKRFLFSEDPDVTFGTLDETSLEGFIKSVDMSIRHLAAVSQTPPHYLLGQIANLSAEALQAAETALSRKITEYQAAFGESWERVFRLAGEMLGDPDMTDDYSGEVLWRDMEQRSLAQAADALGKLSESLDIPKQGLWSRVPNVTKGEMDEWERLAEGQNFDSRMADALERQRQEADRMMTDYGAA